MTKFETDIFERLGIAPQEYFKLIDLKKRKFMCMIDVDFTVYAFADYDEENDANIIIELNNSENIINDLLNGNIEIIKLPQDFNAVLSNRENIIIQYIDEVY